MKDLFAFVEIMKMFEILIVEVITKHDSPCLPYLGVFRMLQSTDVITKTKLTRDKCRRLEVFCKKDIFKNLAKFIEILCLSLFKKVAGLQIAALSKRGSSTVGFL